MKRLSLLKNLGLLSGSALCAVPMIVSSTGCSCAIKAFEVDELSYSNYLTVTSQSNVKRSKVKFDKILVGSKDLHDGNYVFILGSVMEGALDKFMGEGKTREGYYSEFLSSSVMYNVIKEMPAHDEAKAGIKDFGVYSYIDYFDGKFYDKKNHEILIAGHDKPQLAIQNIKPFDTWGDKISATKILNKKEKNYDWDDTSVSSNDFIRNDDSAVAYRKFIERAIKLYPKTSKRTSTFTDSKNSENCKIAIFKDGVLSSIEALPGNDETAVKSFAEKLVKLYKK